MADERRDYEPHDRLTRLCEAMTAALQEHPEFEGDEKVIVMIHDTERGGQQMFGYENDREVAADIFEHARAFFRTTGYDLHVFAMPNAPGQG